MSLVFDCMGFIISLSPPARSYRTAAEQQAPKQNDRLVTVNGFSVPMEFEYVQFMNCVNNNGRMQKRIHGFHIGSRPYQLFAAELAEIRTPSSGGD